MKARHLCLQFVRSIQVTLDRLFIWVANQQWDYDKIRGSLSKTYLSTFLRKGIHCVPTYLSNDFREEEKMIQEFLGLVFF